MLLRAPTGYYLQATCGYWLPATAWQRVAFGLCAERLSAFGSVDPFEPDSDRCAAIDPRAHGIAVRNRDDRGRDRPADQPEQIGPRLAARFNGDKQQGGNRDREGCL